MWRQLPGGSHTPKWTPSLLERPSEGEEREEEGKEEKDEREEEEWEGEESHG